MMMMMMRSSTLQWICITVWSEFFSLIYANYTFNLTDIMRVHVSVVNWCVRPMTGCEDMVLCMWFMQKWLKSAVFMVLDLPVYSLSKISHKLHCRHTWKCWGMVIMTVSQRLALPSATMDNGHIWEICGLCIKALVFWVINKKLNLVQSFNLWRIAAHLYFAIHHIYN